MAALIPDEKTYFASFLVCAKFAQEANSDISTATSG